MWGLFSCFRTQAVETTNEENLLLILALTAHALTISFKERAEAFLWSFVELFSAQHGLWATGDDKLWAPALLPKLLTVHLSVLCRELLARQWNRIKIKVTCGNITLNLFEIKEVTNALRTLDIMSDTSFSQVPCCVEHFTYWPNVYKEVLCANRFFF